VCKALTLAHRVVGVLEKSGADVALIARAGQDLSRYGLRYSHLGIVWRDHPNGRWAVVHQLNLCGTAESALFAEGLGVFFLDEMHAYDALIHVPGPKTRKELVQALSSDLPRTLHGLPYNMVSYAYSTRYQNSNQWVLETLAGAFLGTADVITRARSQEWLRQQGYQPITLQIDALTRLGGRMFRANIAFDDHPFDRRMAGQIDTVTVESVYRFLERRDPEHRNLLVSLDGQ